MLVNIHFSHLKSCMSIEWLSTISLAAMRPRFNHHHGKILNLPWLNEDGAEDEKLKLCYGLHKHLILKLKTKACTNYSFLSSESLDFTQMIRQIEEIFEGNDCAFKINLSFGLILVIIQSHPREYRYFVPYRNVNLFDRPMMIQNRNDLNRIQLRLQQLDVIGYALKQRPNTKFKPIMITNVVKLHFPYEVVKKKQLHQTKPKHSSVRK